MRDRIEQAFQQSGMTKQEFEQQTGISWFKWQNLFSGKQRVNEDHLNAVNTLWPQYAYWFVTGKTMPEAGQISPEIEQARSNSKEPPKATG